MTVNIRDAMKARLAAGLRKLSQTKCSKWAEDVVYMPEPFPGKLSWKYHPWLKAMHDPGVDSVVGMKSAQVGFTVAMLNRTLWAIDVMRQSVLYLLPTKTPDATDFSATRFSPALEASEYLSELFSDVSNVATKRAGSAVLYIRGANSRPGLKSIPVARIMFDEFDEMPPENIPLAMARMDGQRQTEVWKVSTPTLPNKKIHAEYLSSTQEHFFFKCPGCSRHIELTEDNLITYTDDLMDEAGLMKSQIICLDCKKVLVEGKPTCDAKVEMLSSGLWVAAADPLIPKRGFYINQLYSSALAGQPYILAKGKIAGENDLHSKQEWKNSKMGVPNSIDGAQIDISVFDELCKKDLRMVNWQRVENNTVRTMGVDVGTYLHVEVDGWNFDKAGRDINITAIPTALLLAKFKNFEELDTLMKDYQINFCVIDANPEGRKATEFAKRFWRYVKLCYYGRDKAPKTIEKTAEACEYKITVDRTSWMDLALGRFHSKRLILPWDTPQEYKDHICEPARVLRLDAMGNPTATYINERADHYAHARTYAEIALPLAAAKVTGRDIESFL